MKEKEDYQKKINQMAVAFNLELVRLLRGMISDTSRIEKRITKLEKKRDK